MRVIRIEESKKDKMSEYAEKMLKYGGKLMQCIESLGEGSMGQRDDEDYDDDEDEEFDEDEIDYECDGDCAGCEFDCGYDEDDFDDEEEDEYFEVICPACGDVINFDSSIDPENLRCPNCGEKFECIVEEDDLKALDGEN